MIERLPIFCYGTLRPDGGNDCLWNQRGHARHDGTAVAIGYKLVARQRAWFPYLVPAMTAQTRGTLIVPDPDCYDDVLACLDRLEGVPHHYLRVVVAVLTPDGPVRAWAYIAADLQDRLLDDVPTDTDGYFVWPTTTT